MVSGGSKLRVEKWFLGLEMFLGRVSEVLFVVRLVGRQWEWCCCHMLMLVERGK